MQNEKPKVLLILDAVSGHSPWLNWFIAKAGEMNLPYELETLKTSIPPRAEMEEQIAQHLRRKEYDLVVSPRELFALDAIRAQHTGRVAGYAGTRALDFGRYDVDIDLIERPSRDSPREWFANKIRQALQPSESLSH